MTEILMAAAKKQSKTTLSITFCECGENDSNGMEKLGEKAAKGQGLNLEDLKKGALIAKEKLGIKGKIVSFAPLLDGVDLIDKKGRKGKVHEAWALRIQGFVNAVLKGSGKTMKDLFNELNKVTWDTQYWDNKKKKVLNKRARANNCFGDYSQTANINEGKGSIHNFKDLPLLSLVRKMLYEMFGDKVKLFIAEGNRYEDGGA